jgi:hypothetical protein
MWLLNLLKYFSIDVNCCLGALTSRLIPKKERLINKNRLLRRPNSSLDTDSSRTPALHKDSDTESPFLCYSYRAYFYN